MVGSEDDQDPGSAGAGYARALSQFEGLPLPLTRAWALTHYGAFLARLNEPERGRAMLASAVRLAEGCDAGWHASWARAEWRRAGGRRKTPSGELTPREAAVARLARAGRTNRQIAQQLFLSVNTVETHLANVYRKLGIRRRWQLIASPDPDSPDDQPPE